MPAPPSRGSRRVSAASLAPCPLVPRVDLRGGAPQELGAGGGGRVALLSAALVWPARRPPFLSLCCRRVVVVRKCSLFPAARPTCSRRGRASNTFFSLMNFLLCGRSFICNEMRWCHWLVTLCDFPVYDFMT